MSTLTEKLMTYAVGRGLKYYDMPVVRSITRDAGRNDYRFSAIVLGIVKSAPFQMKMKPADSRAASGSSRKQEAMTFITKKHLPRRTFLRGAGVAIALPLARFHGSRADAARTDRGESQEPSRMHLCAARRDHGQMDARDRGQGLRVHRDSEAA